MLGHCVMGQQPQYTTMSASRGNPAAAFFSASIPSGFDPGPANTACGRCLLLYNTGNATAKIAGALPAGSVSSLASAGGSSTADAGQGSPVLWLTRANGSSN